MIVVTSVVVLGPYVVKVVDGISVVVVVDDASVVKVVVVVGTLVAVVGISEWQMLGPEWQSVLL